jgi:hypothetical protein
MSRATHLSLSYIFNRPPYLMICGSNIPKNTKRDKTTPVHPKKSERYPIRLNPSTRNDRLPNMIALIAKGSDNQIRGKNKKPKIPNNMCSEVSLS